MKYTDDSVLTLAIASALLIDGHPYREQVQSIGRNRPYNSYGNGAAMRVSPVAYAFSTMEELHQNRIVDEYPAHTVMLEENGDIDPKINLK